MLHFGMCFTFESYIFSKNSKNVMVLRNAIYGLFFLEAIEANGTALIYKKFL